MCLAFGLIALVYLVFSGGVLYDSHELLLSESFPSREARRKKKTQLQQLQERRRWRVKKVKVKNIERS